MRRNFISVLIFCLLAVNDICAQASDTLRIAHLADPQLGFGSGGFDDDLAAFRIEIEHINALQPDLVAIAGDMVNRMDSVSVARFKEAAAGITVPVVYTPGNHDIAEPPTHKGLETYRAAFGTDFSVVSVKGRTLISFNSLLMRGGPADESEAHIAKLRRALLDARAVGSPVILLCHVPPFAASVDEADEYYNLPLAHRRAIFDMAADGGAFIWLCGHTHKTHRNDYAGIAVLNPENTSCNFDRRPKGFRLLTIAPDNTFSWDFVPKE